MFIQSDKGTVIPMTSVIGFIPMSSTTTKVKLIGSSADITITKSIPQIIKDAVYISDSTSEILPFVLSALDKMNGIDQRIDNINTVVENCVVKVDNKQEQAVQSIIKNTRKEVGELADVVKGINTEVERLVKTNSTLHHATEATEIISSKVNDILGELQHESIT